MGYKYQNTCYETLAEATQAEADLCGLNIGGTTNASWVGFCEVSGTNIQFKYGAVGSSTFSTSTLPYTPLYATCNYDTSTNTFTNADVISMAWLVVSVWVIAWGFKKMIEVLRK